MFIESQSKTDIDAYKELLAMVGSLSGLFSESEEPYLAYRVAENLFCESFQATNLSRSDASVDASKNKVGIGIKTFLNKNGATMQKVAEFNSEYHLFNDLNLEDKVRKICELRNERIDSTKRIYGLDEVHYHCLVRRKGEILVYETPMDPVNIEGIGNIVEKKNAITFNDGINEYSFSSTKSTLYKRFHTADILLKVPVAILKDPLAVLAELLKSNAGKLAFAPIKTHEHIFLPLYSTKGDKIVPEKSGLNQWNADGRHRDFNEVYIPIPAWIHKEYPGFFPGRDEPFTLILPNKEEMSAKVCQEGSKALMSNPNSAIGKWLLRDVLNLSDGQLLTYETLERVGLDSVVLYKIGNGVYEVDFAKLDSYEEFKNESANQVEGSISSEN